MILKINDFNKISTTNLNKYKKVLFKNVYFNIINGKVAIENKKQNDVVYRIIYKKRNWKTNEQVLLLFASINKMNDIINNTRFFCRSMRKAATISYNLNKRYTNMCEIIQHYLDILISFKKYEMVNDIIQYKNVKIIYYMFIANMYVNNDDQDIEVSFGQYTYNRKAFFESYLNQDIDDFKYFVDLFGRHERHIKLNKIRNKIKGEN